MPSSSTLFREEALESYVRSSRLHGHVLDLSPRWMIWTYWLVVAVCVAGSIYGVCASLHEYATGVAILRDEARTQVRPSAAARLRPSPCSQGNTWRPRRNFYASTTPRRKLTWNVSARNSISNRFADSLIPTIRRHSSTWPPSAPRWPVPKNGCTSASSTRRVLAWCATCVCPQQAVTAGDFLLTLVGPEDRLSVVAILPGQYRPLLKPGSPLRLELSGFRYAYQRLTIAAVGHEVICPQEVRRFLGQDVGDAVALQGASVIVQAQVPADTFYADGHWHPYHDGMHGTAEVRVRSERMVLALVPGLKTMFGGDHGQGEKHSSAR